MRGYKAAVDTWVAAGADIFLSGHTHQSFVAPLLGSARQAWVVQTGTAVSCRIREQVPNSVHLLSRNVVPSGGLVMGRFDWDGVSSFNQVTTKEVALASARDQVNAARW